jgi:aminoglycoside phosphotransferase family enzyme/predicted kinase
MPSIPHQTDAFPAASTQESVLRWLADPVTHNGAPVRRYDTHANAVFLAGEHAYKVKRAVRFPFLDYSTLQKRKVACDAELRINRLFAPRLYRGVVAITREVDGHLALGGMGEPVEWAVDMVRFDEERTLDHMAARGELDPDLPLRLARLVAAMHAKAPPAEAAAWLEAMVRYLRQNAEAFHNASDLFPEARVSELDQKSHAALDRLMPLLKQRAAQGLVRRCHGDLHLGNVVMLDDEPVAFDAIEFDPVIASGDLLYDLAFLLMDLLERDLCNEANRLFNAYLSKTRRKADYRGVAALPFFISVRAAIRAHVLALRLQQGATTAGLAEDARRYFELALDSLAPARPMLVCIGGLSGTGKSLLARSLAPYLEPQPGAVVLRSDVERKHLFDVEETTRLPATAYTPEVSDRVYRVLTDKALQIASAPYPVIVDAVFGQAAERSAIEMAATRAGLHVRGFFLTTDTTTRVGRVAQRGQGSDASDADVLIAQAQENGVIGALDWLRVDASGRPEETLAAVRRLLP